MARNIQQKHKEIYEELKLFIETCSTSPKSVQNYTDFKRINECIQEVLGNPEITIFDITNPVEFAEIVKKINNNERYRSYNRKGNNQYSSAVLNYQNFLFARKFAASIKPQNERLNFSDKSIQPHNTDDLSLSIENIVQSILSTGLIYSPTLIKRLAFSLMAKPFVILSGLAGSGKTQLTLAFAKCLSEKIKEQVCTVSIGADWTNREPLLGYPNALNKDEYVLLESGVLQLLIRANEDSSKPYFLILDEMNLSVVERYFADFLSAMESRETGFVSFLDEKNAVKWTPPDNNGIVPYIKPICFTIPKNVIVDRKIKAFQLDKTGNRIEFDFQYITTIKQNYAQRIANHAFAYPIRVGVDFV